MGFMDFLKDAFVSQPRPQQPQKTTHQADTDIESFIEFDTPPLFQLKTDDKIEKQFVKYCNLYIKKTCPYCGTIFEKEITRKKKCPDCGNQIIVTTNELNKHKMLLTENDMKTLEKERSINNRIIGLNMYLGFNNISEKEFTVYKNELLAQNPAFTDNDVVWGLLVNKGNVYAIKKQWSRFRVIQESMGRFLVDEKRYAGALAHYAIVLYMDINGAQDVHYEDEPEFMKELSAIVPVMIKEVNHIAMGNVTVEDFRVIFFHDTQSYYRKNITPYSPEQAWKMIEKELAF